MHLSARMSFAALPALLLIASGLSRNTLPCSVRPLRDNPEGYVWPEKDIRNFVRQADAVVRAVVLDDAGPPAPSPIRYPDDKGIRFRSIEVLQGTVSDSVFTLRGKLVDRDDFNLQPVPYRMVRSAGGGGDCFAREYRKGGEYLLLMKGTPGGWSAHWAPLAPTNEQLRPGNDRWLEWVRGQIASAREPRPDTLFPAGAMRERRSVHTATTLQSGLVLIAGGMPTGGGGLASAELYDPKRNRSDSIAPMSAKRSGHTATLVADGRVVIAGGFDGEYHASIEIYEPDRKVFRRAGRMTEPRSGHTATLLRDGRILLVGGVGSGWTFLRSAEIYDPATERSVAVGAMSVPREGHTATLISRGEVLIVGGHTGRRQNMQVHASAEVFSATSGRFVSIGRLSTPRHKHDAVGLGDGRVLVIGGADRTDRNHFSSTEWFDPRTRRFLDGPSMAEARYKIAGTTLVLPSGAVLVAAGAPHAEILDDGATEFRAIPGRFPNGFLFAATGLLPDGSAVISGGYSEGTVQSSNGIWRYRP